MMSDSYPPDWDSRREEVYARDDFKCQNCGINADNRQGAGLHAHHIVPISSGGTHDLSNLTTICQQCHRAVHNESVQANSESKSGGQRLGSGFNPDQLDGDARGIYDTFQTFKKVAEPIDDLNYCFRQLHDYTEKMFEYVDKQSDKAPDKLEDAYHTVYSSAYDHLSQIREVLMKMRDIQDQYDFQDPFDSELTKLLDRIEEYIQASDEYLSAFTDIATPEDGSMEIHAASKDSVEWDVNIDIGEERHAKAFEKVTDVELYEKLEQTGRDLIKKMNK